MCRYFKSAVYISTLLSVNDDKRYQSVYVHHNENYACVALKTSGELMPEVTGLCRCHVKDKTKSMAFCHPLDGESIYEELVWVINFFK